MALLRAKPHEMPSDAILLSEQDALEYQMKVIRGWKNGSDVFAIKYGPGILAGAAAATGIYLNSYYRRKYMLFDYAKIASYLPICVIPAISTIAVHSNFILHDVILRKGNCPICIEMRSSAAQAGVACVFPVLLANVSSISIAQRYGTYNLPDYREPLKLMQLAVKQTRPIANTLFVIFVAQAILASVVTFYESESVHKVNIRLLQLERELEGELEASGKISTS